jgi:hypothetical protein
MGARTKDVTGRTDGPGYTGSTGAPVVRRGRLKVGLQNSYSLGAYLFLAATVIILAFLVYMQIFVVDPMRRDSRDIIKRLAFFYGMATQDTVVVSDLDVEFIFQTISNTNFPVVITGSRGEPHMWKAIEIPLGNPGDLGPDDLRRMQGIVRRLDTENPPYSFEFRRSVRASCTMAIHRWYDGWHGCRGLRFASRRSLSGWVISDFAISKTANRDRSG